MFALSKERINCEARKHSLLNAKAGALATFEGWVRNHNDGREVLTLAYEAYETLAVKEAENIIQEAKERFDIYDASCVHRVGELSIGDVAVWVGAIAAHRGTAFDACRYIIDEIKHRLPIWKKETYTDGSSGWVNCQSGCGQDTGISEQGYYSRQTILREVGESGQQQLKEAKVLVIGAGGLGSSALLYLAGAGVGTIGICDSDRVEESNLHRQVLFGQSSVGQLKTEAAANRLRELNPFINVVIHSERFDARNAKQLFESYDIILDCSDNFETKFLANDMTLATGKTLIQASIYQYEGQLLLLRPTAASHEHLGQCLRCLWPDASKKATELSCIGSCAEVGVLGVVPGVFGTLQATEAIKCILEMPTSLNENVLLFDLLSYSTRSVKRTVRNGCVCGSRDIHIAPAIAVDKIASSELTYDESKTIPNLIVIDIRDEQEREASALQPRDFWNRAIFHNVPANNILDGQVKLDREHTYLLVCLAGVRSQGAADKLRSDGWLNVFSLPGGLRAVARDSQNEKTLQTAGNEVTK